VVPRSSVTEPASMTPDEVGHADYSDAAAWDAGCGASGRGGRDQVCGELSRERTSIEPDDRAMADLLLTS
jgi:hypothetical protein